MTSEIVFCNYQPRKGNSETSRNQKHLSLQLETSLFVFVTHVFACNLTFEFCDFDQLVTINISNDKLRLHIIQKIHIFVYLRFKLHLLVRKAPNKSTK